MCASEACGHLRLYPALFPEVLGFSLSLCEETRRHRHFRLFFSGFVRESKGRRVFDGVTADPLLGGRCRLYAPLVFFPFRLCACCIAQKAYHVRRSSLVKI